MPLFYFHVDNDCTILDAEGTEVPDTDATLRHSLLTPGRCFAQTARKIAASCLGRI
jgi:Domain of unknown function (DUF6894)